MFVSFLLVALLATLVPLVGGVVMLMSLPLLSLGFMIASRAAQNDLPVNPGQFIEPLRGERSRRNTLLSLCAAYALGTVLIMTLSEWIDGGAFDRLQALMAKGDEARAEMEALLADPRLTWGLITRFGLAACLSVPFWHAPALVYWQGQSVGQALFSSTLAMWRCKGAFLMYSLAWVGVIAIFGALVGAAVQPVRRPPAGRRDRHAGRPDVLHRVLRVAAVHLRRLLQPDRRAAATAAVALNRSASAWRCPAPATWCRGGRS